MSQIIMRFFVIILAILSYANSQMSQPQFSIKAESNKAFDEFCLIGTFKITNGNIADCLEHCLENCSCQLFQICQNTQCQLCSNSKEGNSSLLHDERDCVYAMFEIQHLTESFQKMDEQCSGMSCLLKYNCCQQSGLCPKNKICKTIYNITQPWKRFTCECPDGYLGDNCEQPITSCRGYLNGSRESGIYLVRDSKSALYQVYCDFDSNGAWTLVPSYSYANYTSTKSNEKFKVPLSKDIAVSENVPQWSGYRLSKERMKSINKDSQLRLRFTCNYQKHNDVNSSDYIEVSLRYDSRGKKKIIDVFLKNKVNTHRTVHGKIRGFQLDGCKIWLHQANKDDLHINIKSRAQNTNCRPALPSGCNYFGKYQENCLDKEHLCVKNDYSTTQLWFGN